MIPVNFKKSVGDIVWNDFSQNRNFEKKYLFFSRICHFMHKLLINHTVRGYKNWIVSCCSNFMSFSPIDFIFIGCIGYDDKFGLGTQKFRI